MPASSAFSSGMVPSLDRALMSHWANPDFNDVMIKKCHYKKLNEHPNVLTVLGSSCLPCPARLLPWHQNPKDQHYCLGQQSSESGISALPF